MRILYAIRHVGLTGGVKVFFQHAELLTKMGHRVFIIARFVDENWEFKVRPEIVPSFEDKYIPKVDGIVVTTPKDIEDLWEVAQKRMIPLFHFLQGFEPDYILERIRGDVIPPQFRGRGIITRLKYMKKMLTWKRKLKRFDRLYKLPTIKIAISPHLIRSVKDRYRVECYLLQNGIDRNIFHPKEKPSDYRGTLKILSVGNYNIEYKAIPDVLEAVRILKGKGIDCHLTRVSPADIPEEEQGSGIVDRFFVRVSEEKMAELYRESHILIAASTEIEGFGLPAIEAMSAGTPVILTRVSPFLSFDELHDYAYFVNVHRPDEIAEGVVKIAMNQELRKSLIERGLEVAARYSLERVGRELEKILNAHIRAD